MQVPFKRMGIVGQIDQSITAQGSCDRSVVLAPGGTLSCGDSLAPPLVSTTGFKEVDVVFTELNLFPSGLRAKFKPLISGKAIPFILRSNLPCPLCMSPVLAIQSRHDLRAEVMEALASKVDAVIGDRNDVCAHLRQSMIVIASDEHDVD